MPDQLIILMPLVVAILLYFETKPYLKIKKMGEIVLNVQELKLVTKIAIIMAAVFLTGFIIYCGLFFYTRALKATEFFRGTEGMDIAPAYFLHIGYISGMGYYLGKLIIFLLQFSEKDSIREMGLVKGGRGYLWNEITKYEWVENKIKITAAPASFFKLNDSIQFEIVILPQYKEDVENILKSNI